MSGEATNFVRLACVRHAASVRPEPGSNSRLIFLLKITLSIIFFVFHYFFCSLSNSAVSFTKFSAPCVAKFGNSLRLTYHRFFSPLRSVKSDQVILKGFLCCFIVYVRRCLLGQLQQIIIPLGTCQLLFFFFYFLFSLPYLDRNVSLAQTLFSVN